MLNPLNPSRRRLTAMAILGALGAPALATPKKVAIEVWKGPDCSCCEDWIKVLRTQGFQVRSHDSGNSDARAALGLPARYGSCHTAKVEGYALEGHVPVREIRRLLQERPEAVGLAVPAMPRGSPGMDGPEYGGQRDPYDVLLVQRDGSARVYQSYR